MRTRLEATHGRTGSGFSLIELLIVVAVIAILATITVPSFLSSKVVSNETAVVAAMKNIATSQLMFVQSRNADMNQDSAGEFGFLGELSGVNPVRGSGEYLRPPPLSQSFGDVDANGYSQRNGYWFRLYLPDAAGLGVEETASKIGTVDAATASVYFTVVAWPKVYGNTGQRTFFMNQAGEIVATVDPAYSGQSGTPIANAALIGVPAGVITTNSMATGGQVGVDGNRWQGAR